MPRAKTPEETHAIKVSVSFEAEQYKELIAYCERNERSLAWVVRRALLEWLPKHKDDTLD